MALALAPPSIIFFCCPKPWTAEFKDIQTLAISSWREFGPVYILGDESGNSEAAKSLDCIHIPDIQKNEWGTPILTSIFDKISEVAGQLPPLSACYINADIVLDKSFQNTINAVLDFTKRGKLSEWLVVGKRLDVSMTHTQLTTLTISEVQTYARKYGKMHAADGIDYFVFTPKTFSFVYPFAIGKFVWDQWLVGNAYRRGVCCIDASATIQATHLNADWFFQGKPTNNREEIYNSPEGLINRNFDAYQRNIANGTNHHTVKTYPIEIKKILE